MEKAPTTPYFGEVQLENLPLVAGQPLVHTRGKTKIVRKDGLTVWLDSGETKEERIVNTLRVTAPKDVVHAAVALLRGRQVYMNYAGITEKTKKRHFGMFFSSALQQLDALKYLEQAQVKVIK